MPAVIATYVIGLREGLEAALIVSIVAAFLRQQNQRAALRYVWIGVAIAVAVCVAVGVALQVLPQRRQEQLETVVGLAAVGIVTFVIVWMRRHARGLRDELEAHAAAARHSGSHAGASAAVAAASDSACPGAGGRAAAAGPPHVLRRPYGAIDALLAHAAGAPTPPRHGLEPRRSGPTPCSRRARRAVCAPPTAVQTAATAPGEVTVSRATVVADAGVIVFREGLEAVLILAAITASFTGARRRLRRPVLMGALCGLLATAATYAIAQTLVDALGDGGLRLGSSPDRPPALCCWG